MGLTRRTASICMKCVLLYHLIENTVFLTLSVGDIFALQDTVKTASRLSSRLAVAGYAVLGLPIIGTALWGTMRRVERPLRLYFYYLGVSAIINAAYTTDALAHFLPCAAGRAPAPAPGPNIFQCGHARGVVLIVLFFIVGFQLSMLYPVYTFCEDLKWDGESAEEQSQDGKSRPPMRQRATSAPWMGLREGPLSQIHGRMLGEYGSIYETAAAIGASQSVTAGSNARLPYLPATRLV